METKKTLQGVSRMFTFLFISGLCVFIQSTIAQEVKKQNKPDIKYKVNKEYDDKGNITRYDSTYSYSWSGSSQIPTDIDSIFRRFNQHGFFSFGIDSSFNHFGFNTPFINDTTYNFSLPNFNEQLKDFINSSPFSFDPFSDENFDNFLGSDFQKQFKEQRKQLEKIFHELYFDQDSIYNSNKQRTPVKPIPQEKAKPEKQNYFPNKKGDKTIST